MRPAQPSDFPGKWRLWVHCPGLLESHLHEYFSQFGTVIDLYIPRDRHNGARKSYGFVTFETEDGLRRTLAAGSEHLMNGRTVRVNLAGPRPEQQQLSQEGPNQGDAALGQRSRQQGWPASPSGQPQFASPGRPSDVAESSGADKGRGPRIYVGGIPTAVSETMVRNHFSQWGQVVDVYFPKDRALNRRKNFCFVTFATQQAAKKAAAQSNREISGYRIESISITHERQEHYIRKRGVLPGAGMEYEEAGASGHAEYGTGGAAAISNLEGQLGAMTPFPVGLGGQNEANVAAAKWAMAQQALLQSGRMGTGHAGLGVPNVMFDVGAGAEGSMIPGAHPQYRQQQIDPAMMYQAYGPDLGMARLGRGLPGIAEEYVQHSQAAFQQGPAANPGAYTGKDASQQPSQGAGPSDPQNYY